MEAVNNIAYRAVMTSLEAVNPIIYCAGGGEAGGF
jgi:hypothetical protein